MKSIPQNILILIGCIVVALIILGVFGFYSTKAPLQRQAIHIFDEPALKLSNPNGLVKISEIKPNSAVSFYYPDPDRFKNRDPFEQFILIRLPDYLGGTVNDVSAFRVYSVIDPTSHCIVKYWPQEGRRKIEDSCSGNMYDPVSGHATTNFGHSVLVSKNVALPYLTISSDETGFLYVEPPVWTEDKNGVIGIGRTISEEEIQATAQLTASREKQFRDAMEEFLVPDKFSTGHELDHIGNNGMGTNLAEYFGQDSSPIMLFYAYCNCTKSKELLADEEMTRSNSQILDVDGVQVVAYPNAVVDYVNRVYDKYVFVFYHDGYRISLHTNQKLDTGLALVKELLDSSNTDEPIEDKIPSDFSIVYSFGIDGKNVFDSTKNHFLADMVCDPPIEVPIRLSDTEKQRIWQSVLERDFFSFGNFTQNCDESGQCLGISPEEFTTLSVTGNGKTHTVQHRGSYLYNDNEDYLKFEEITNVINDMLRSRDDFKNIPSPRCAYQ